MSKIYTYFLLLLLFISPGRMVFSQCPPEPLLVEFEAYAVRQDYQIAKFNTDSLKLRLQSLLATQLNVDKSSVNITNIRDKKEYTYCSNNGYQNTYDYIAGVQSGTGCPVTIKVLDRYNPNCAKKNGGNQDNQINYCPTIPSTLSVSGCTVTKEELDDFFNVFSVSEIEKYNSNLSYRNFADWNDEMWQNGNSVCKGGSSLKEAYIDWENTDISNFRLGDTNEDVLEIQYVLLDNAGNKGFRYRYQSSVIMPCRAKVKVKLSNYGDLLCPDYSVLSNTEVVLDLPSVPNGDYVVWNTTGGTLNGPKKVNYVWTPSSDGISVMNFPQEGIYKFTIKGKVCNRTDKTVTCPVNVVKKVDSCDPK